MYISVEEFDILEKAVKLLPYGEGFNALSHEEQATILKADLVLQELYRKRKAFNKKTATYVAERRKTDKNYGRGKKNG